VAVAASLVRESVELEADSNHSNLELRPSLRRAGGKRCLIPELQKISSRHSPRRLVQPFCGGLAEALTPATQPDVPGNGSKSTRNRSS
jgi:hypothetical protein